MHIEIAVAREVLDMVFYTMYDEEKLDSMDPVVLAEIYKKCDAFTRKLPDEVNAALKARLIFSPYPWTKKEADTFIAQYRIQVI